MIIGSKYIFREKLPSTNGYASKLLKNSKIQEGTIIHTNFQTEGHGQANNTWESEENKNLLISIILYPKRISPMEQFIISKTISLGICDFLRQYATNVSIKWPNDIYISNDKIAGILIEVSIISNEIENIIAGIGLNINQRRFQSDAPNPVSLYLVTGMEYSLEELLSGLASYLDRRYYQLLHGKTVELDKEYINSLYRYNEWSEYSDSNGVFEGRIISVSPGGRLQIEDHKGRVYEYSFKEVNFL